jgi:hypothetical protein
MMERFDRPLTAEERTQVTARRDFARRSAAGVLWRSGAASVLVCGVLAVLTLLASDAPAIVVFGFWAAMAALFGLWSAVPARRSWRRQATALDAGLAANYARVTRIASDRVVEFEEFEDEGACYAFDAGNGRAVILTGQEFYEDESFPNSDFSIVQVMAGQAVVDMLITRAGRKITPERVVPAAKKVELDLPDDLQVMEVPLERVGL